MAPSGSSSLSRLQSLHGIFAVYKKQGPTSADVLNALKEALLKEAGVKNPNPRKRKKQSLKMGHGGTLDSAASGVLVVGVGDGTKMLSRMLTGSKKYVAVGELGKATDTLDATGSLVLERDYEHVTIQDLEEKLKTFTGDILQVPPLYSALKQGGQRLSVLIQKGHHVEAKPARRVSVFSLSLRDFQPPLFTLDIECGGGFYVRSLVDDLGKALSSCAHIKQLVRTKQGPFTLQQHALQEDRWTLEHVLRVLQPCSQGAPELHQPSSQGAPELHQPCSQGAPELHQPSSQGAPELHQPSSQGAPELHQPCSQGAPELHQPSSQGAPELHQPSSQGAPELHQPCSQGAPELHQPGPPEDGR